MRLHTTSRILKEAKKIGAECAGLKKGIDTKWIVAHKLRYLYPDAEVRRTPDRDAGARSIGVLRLASN